MTAVRGKQVCRVITTSIGFGVVFALVFTGVYTPEANAGPGERVIGMYDIGPHRDCHNLDSSGYTGSDGGFEVFGAPGNSNTKHDIIVINGSGPQAALGICGGVDLNGEVMESASGGAWSKGGGGFIRRWVWENDNLENDDGRGLVPNMGQGSSLGEGHTELFQCYGVENASGQTEFYDTDPGADARLWCGVIFLASGDHDLN